MAEIVTVKAKRQDGRVAFWERNRVHPRGEVFIAGNDKAVQVARTAAVDAALGDGRLVLVQTQETKTQGTQQTPVEGLTGLGLTAEQEKALTDAGYGDRAKLAAAGDDDLIAVEGVGKATVANIRKALETRK